MPKNRPKTACKQVEREELQECACYALAAHQKRNVLALFRRARSVFLRQASRLGNQWVDCESRASTGKEQSAEKRRKWKNAGNYWDYQVAWRELNKLICGANTWVVHSFTAALAETEVNKLLQEMFLISLTMLTSTTRIRLIEWKRNREILLLELWNSRGGAVMDGGLWQLCTDERLWCWDHCRKAGAGTDIRSSCRLRLLSRHWTFLHENVLFVV